MLPEEKDKLLALFSTEQRWCQDAEARDAQGEPVRYSDESAVAWDLTGGLCLLFGWRRSCALFGQIDRHIFGDQRDRWRGPDPEIQSMVALQVFNDSGDTTYETLLERLRSIAAYVGKS
ncbi:MAG: hypothetical protein HQ546_10555 [Planctomycetes bacterium]|nr:hypothetical protein [Planctomycetota bacterium]